MDNPKTYETTWWNMGIFLINNPDSVYSATERTLNFEGLDLMAKFTGKRNGQLVAPITKVAVDTKIATAVRNILEYEGFTKYIINDVGYVVPYDIKKEASSTTYDLLSELRDLYPDWEMFFDTDGVFHWQEIPDGKEQPIILDFDTLEQPIIVSEAINVDFENVKNNIVVYGRLDDLGKQVYATTADELEDSPFNIDKIGVINYVITDEKISTDYLAALRANYELYIHSRLNDAVDFNIVPVYWLNDVNVKIKRTNKTLGLDGEYLIQKVEIPLGIGETMKINASKIYEDWQFKPSDDFITVSLDVLNVTSNSITVKMRADSLSNISHVNLISNGDVMVDKDITDEIKTFEEEYTITELTADSSYNIIFTAENIRDNDAVFTVNVRTHEERPEGQVSVRLNIDYISHDEFRVNNVYTSTYPISKATLTVTGDGYEYSSFSLSDSYTITNLQPNTIYTVTITLEDIYGKQGSDTLQVTTSPESDIQARISKVSIGAIYNNRVDYLYDITSSSGTINNIKLKARWLATGEITTLDDYTPSSTTEKSKVSRKANIRNDAILTNNAELMLTATDDNGLTSDYNIEIKSQNNREGKITIGISEIEVLPQSTGKYKIKFKLNSVADTEYGGDYIYYYLDNAQFQSFVHKPFSNYDNLVYIDDYFTTDAIELEPNRNYQFKVQVSERSTSTTIAGIASTYIRV